MHILFLPAAVMTVRAAGIKLIEPGAAHPAGAETTALTFQKGASVRSSGMDGWRRIPHRHKHFGGLFQKAVTHRFV